jgi:hypothetical protein
MSGLESTVRDRRRYASLITDSLSPFSPEYWIGQSPASKALESLENRFLHALLIHRERKSAATTAPMANTRMPKPIGTTAEPAAG